MSLKLNNDTANGSVTLQASNTATGDVVATLPPFSTELAPRMQLMTAKTASGTSVDFTNIPSWAKRITVMFNDVSTSGTSQLVVRIGTSSGIVASGYGGAVNDVNGSNACGVSASDGTGINISGRSLSGASALYRGNLTLTLGNTNLFTWTSTLASGTYIYTGAGVAGSASTLTQLRITTVNGTDTFDAGAINILVEG